MEQLAMIFGIGIVCFLFIYFAFKLDKEHDLLKLALLLASIFLLLLIPQYALEEKDHCSFVVNQTLTDANYTTYDYNYLCVTNVSDTSGTFYKSMIWIIRIIIAYLLIYLIYKSIAGLVESLKGKV